MARTPIHDNPHRANILIDGTLYAAAQKRAKLEGFSGGLSEYIARLLVADIGKKRSGALRSSRFLKKAA